jgi:hypothetical protein
MLPIESESVQRAIFCDWLTPLVTVTMRGARPGRPELADCYGLPTTAYQRTAVSRRAEEPERAGRGEFKAEDGLASREYHGCDAGGPVRGLYGT